MRYIENVTDLGIVLSPDGQGEKYYPWDGGGVREAVVNREGDSYYLSYDGAMPGARPDSYWNACLAKSTDLRQWEKMGVSLTTSALNHPEGTPEDYKDLRSASSPWAFREGGRWYRYYVGADHCSPEGIPAFHYSTMLATAERMEGPWHQKSAEPGCGSHLCFPMGKPGSWDDVTASPGQVIVNPEYEKNPKQEFRYLMFYSGSCSGVTKRSIGIARTDDLSVCDRADAENGHFWQKDNAPILSPDEDIENSSLYFEKSSGLWYLFTNHIRDNAYTDAVWVYWTDDINRWREENKAIVMDASVSGWAKGAIGMPSVIKTAPDTLTLFYDGVKGNGCGHLCRHIGMAQIALPIRVKPEN